MHDNIAPMENISPDLLQNLQGVLFDIDDTFTTHGRIPACSLSALWDLKNAGLKLISVTGRPAGWCDHIARMWPVDGVVGENGAFYFWLDEKERKLKTLDRIQQAHSSKSKYFFLTVFFSSPSKSKMVPLICG